MSGGRYQRSPEAKAWQHLYKDPRWLKVIRPNVLRRDRHRCKTCGCLLVGKYPALNSAVVHHRIDHKGNEALFFDERNCEAQCKGCHDGDTQSETALGYSTEIDSDGYPVDPGHPANR